MSKLAFSPILVTRQTCRLCGSRALTPVVSLGDQYIGGAFAKPDCTPPVQRRIPLDLVRCDPALAKAVLGWEPRVTLAEGLAATRTWMDARLAAGRPVL